MQQPACMHLNIQSPYRCPVRTEANQECSTLGRAISLPHFLNLTTWMILVDLLFNLPFSLAPFFTTVIVALRKALGVALLLQFSFVNRFLVHSVTVVSSSRSFEKIS